MSTAITRNFGIPRATQKFEVPRPPPDGAPIVEPAEAIAIALSTAELGQEFSPDSRVVRHVLRAIEKCGWEIVPSMVLR